VMNRILLVFLFLFCIIQTYAQSCSVVSSDIVCKEELMNFDVSASAAISSLKWDLGDATTSTQKTFSHKYSSAGVKTISAIISLSGGGTCTATKQITVYELPQFKLTLKPDNIYCLSQNKVCMIDSSTGGSAGINIKKRIILWDDGSQDVTNNPVIGKPICHTYSNTGKFKVTIELTNDKDCKTKKELDITILPDVIPFFTLSGGKGCDSALLLMEDVTSKDTNQILTRIYDWGDGKKTTTQGRKVGHYYKSGGFYKISLTLVQKNGCRTYRDTVIDIFIPSITFDVTKDAYRKCYGRSFRIEQHDALSGSAYYEWNIGGERKEGKVAEVAPNLGKHYIDLTITFAGCKKTVKKIDSIEVVGIIPDVTVLNDNQCQNKDTVYFCEKDKRYGTKRVSFLWDFGDDMAPSCTTSFKNNQNVKNNCNFATDSFGKHKYVNGICRKWNLNIIDHDYGCNVEETGIINVIRPDTFGFYFTGDRFCLGLKPDYTIYFNKSLCPVIDVKVNIDSACGKNNFVSYYDKYTYQQTCNPNGWVTVGYAITYGNKKVYRSVCDTSDYYIDPSRECHDTIWFHNWFRLLPEPFPPFEAFGRCLPANVKPTLLDSFEKNIAFTSWNWGDKSKVDTLFNAPNDSIIKTPTHVYKKAGAYNISYYIENKNRCYGAYNQLIQLGYNVNMKFDSVICPGIKVKFIDSIRYLYNLQNYWHDLNRKKLNEETFKWDFDDGRGFLIDTINPEITFPAKGIYKIRLAAKDSSDCRDTITKQIYVGGVTAGIKAITKKIICDDIIQFFDSSFSDFKPPSDSIVKFFWEFGDFRNPSYLKDPYHYYNNYGQFTIFHKVENTKGCKDSTKITIQIDGPEPKFDIVSDTVGCAPFRAEFRNRSKKTKDYIWYFGDPLKSKLSTKSDTNVSFTYQKPGIYYIYLFGSDSVVNPNTGNSIHYCSATFPDSSSIKPAIRRIVVLPIPKVDFLVDSIICKDKPFALTDNSDPIYKKYKWVINKMDSTETTNKTGILKSRDTGYFTIKYTPTYIPTGPYERHCFDTTQKTIRVTEIKAGIDFIKEPFCPIFTFTNTSKGAKNLKWDLGHAASGEEKNIIYNQNVVTHNYLPDSGTFYPCLFVESKYGCKDTLCKEFEIDFTVRATIPNVFTPEDKDNKNDAFDIVMKNVETYHLRIYNRWGQLVYHSEVDGTGDDGINWNGKSEPFGVKCPEGTYFYLFNYQFKCEEVKREAHGIITLIR
jgi:gliding motility-associated-like protein